MENPRAMTAARARARASQTQAIPKARARVISRNTAINVANQAIMLETVGTTCVLCRLGQVQTLAMLMGNLSSSRFLSKLLSIELHAFQMSHPHVFLICVLHQQTLLVPSRLCNSFSLGMTVQNMSTAMSMLCLSRFLMVKVTLDQFYWIQALMHLFFHWNLQDQGQLRVQPR